MSSGYLSARDGVFGMTAVAPSATAGTAPPFSRFYGMRIREENCNMVLLAAVTLVSTVIAGGVTLVGADTKSVRLADHTEQMPSSDKRIIYVSDRPPVRVVGAPFVPEHQSPRTISIDTSLRGGTRITSHLSCDAKCTLADTTVTVLSPRTQKRGSYPRLPFHSLASTKAV